MQGDHLSAKVTLAGCAQDASEYAGDFLTLESSKGIPCMDKPSDSCNSSRLLLLVGIMALPSTLACGFDDDKIHILLYVRVDPLFFLCTADFYQQG